MVTPALAVEVEKETAEPAVARGYIYGPWFGGNTFPFDNDVDRSWAAFASSVAEILIGKFIPDPAAIALGITIAGFATAYQSEGINTTGLYGTYKKEYREVKFSDGTLAYYENRYTVSSKLRLSDGTVKTLPKAVEIYESLQPMSLPDVYE